MFVSVDDPIGPEVLVRLRAVDGIVDASVVELPPLP